MNELGTFVLRATFFIAMIAFFLIVFKKHTGEGTHPGILAGVISCIGVLISSVLLMVSLICGIFSVEFVYHNTETSLPLMYKISAFWSGSAGSLLLWVTFFAGLLILIYIRRKNEKETKTIFSVILIFIANFMFVIAFIINPFKHVTPQTDGFGLNPALQSLGMIIHPPVILAGFAFFFIAFAYSFCDLRDKTDENKIHVWRWTLWGWILLTFGIITGGFWAYTELGWGGYWAWDPIENSSLVNWLISTALLHALSNKTEDDRIRVKDRKINFIFITLTIFTILIGTFIARSGILMSVHTYSSKGIQTFLGGFLLILLIAVILIYTRYKKHYSLSVDTKEGIDQRLKSLISPIQLVPVLLLIMAALIFGGTVYPIFGSVDQTPIAYYNTVFSITGLILLLVAGICPMLSSSKRLKIIPGLAAGIIFFLLLSNYDYSILTKISFAVCIMLAINLLVNILINHKIIVKSKKHLSFLIIHLSIVIMALGITGSKGMVNETENIFNFGDTIELSGYSIQYEQLDWKEEPGKITAIASIAIKSSEGIEFLKPELAYYQKRGIKHARAVIKADVWEDLYIIFEGLDESDRVLLKVMVIKYVSLVWVGGILMVIGGIMRFVFENETDKVNTLFRKNKQKPKKALEI